MRDVRKFRKKRTVLDRHLFRCRGWNDSRLFEGLLGFKAFKLFVDIGTRSSVTRSVGGFFLPACVEMVLSNASPEEALTAVAGGRAVVLARRPVAADGAVLGQRRGARGAGFATTRL